MIVNSDVVNAYTSENTKKTKKSKRKNKNLLKSKRIQKIKMSAKGGPLLTFTLPGGGSPLVSYTTDCDACLKFSVLRVGVKTSHNTQYQLLV